MLLWRRKIALLFLGAALLFFSCPYLIPVLCLAPIKKGKKCIMECQAREKFYRDQKNLIANSKNFLVERSMGPAPSKPVLQLAAKVWPFSKNWKTLFQYTFSERCGINKGVCGETDFRNSSFLCCTWPIKNEKIHHGMPGKGKVLSGPKKSYRKQ